MKTLIGLVLLSLLAGPALAAISPQPNVMSVYYDANGDVRCWASPPAEFMNLFIVLTNPTVDAVRGFECGITMSPGAYSIFFDRTYPVDATDTGSGGNFRCEYSVPIPTSTATTLALVQLYLLDPMLDLYFGPADPESPPALGLPRIILEDGSLMSTDYLCNPAAMINSFECDVVLSGTMLVGDCIVPDEETSFSSVKALFR